MYLFAVFCDAFSYMLLYYIGVHLMELVLMHQIEHVSTRWCFVHSFALSVFIIFTGLLSSALNSGHLQIIARILFDTHADSHAASTIATTTTRDDSSAMATSTRASAAHMSAIEAYQSVKLQCALTVLFLLILVVCPAVLLGQVFRGIMRRSGCYMTRLQRRRRSRRKRVYVNVCRILTSAPVLLVSATLVVMFVIALVTVPSLPQEEESAHQQQQQQQYNVVQSIVSGMAGKSWLARVHHVRCSLLTVARKHSTRWQPHARAWTQRVRDVLSTIRLPDEIHRISSSAVVSSRNRSSGAAVGDYAAEKSNPDVAVTQTANTTTTPSADTIETPPTTSAAVVSTAPGHPASDAKIDRLTDKVAIWISEEYLLSYTYLLCAITARLATLGVALMGLLAGYAAFITPYNFLVPYVYWRSRRARLLHTVQILGRRQCQILKMCIAKHRRIAQESYTVQRELPSSAYDGANLSTSETTGGVTTTAGLSQYDYSFSNYSCSAWNSRHNNNNNDPHSSNGNVIVAGGSMAEGVAGGSHHNMSSSNGAKGNASALCYDAMTGAASPFIQSASLHRSLADTASAKANSCRGRAADGVMGVFQHGLNSLRDNLVSGIAESCVSIQRGLRSLVVSTLSSLARVVRHVVHLVVFALLSVLLCVVHRVRCARRWGWRSCGGACGAAGGSCSTAGGCGGGVRYRSVIHQLREEADAAQCLSFNLHLEMTEVDRLLSLSIIGMTWRGKLYAGLGGLLSCYTVANLVHTMINLMTFQQADTAQKPISNFVTLLETAKLLQSSRHNATGSYDAPHSGIGAGLQSEASDSGGLGTNISSIHADWENWSAVGAPPRNKDFLHGAGMFAAQVSGQLIFTLALLANTWIVLNSIRGLILTFFELTLSMRSVITTDATAVGLAMLMGIYFLGQLVLLRQTLPVTVVHHGRYHYHHPGNSSSVYDNVYPLDAKQTITAASVLHTLLQDLPVYYYQRLYEWCFIIGIALTVGAQRAVFGNTITLMPETHTG